MPRPKSLTPSAELRIAISQDLRTRLDEMLFSELEDRVPHGAYSRFFNLMLTQVLIFKTLDLSPFLGTNPGEAIVRADPATLTRLKAHLEQT